MFPEKYSRDAYITWHEQQFPEDAPLLEKLEDMRSKLMDEARYKLKVLAEILVFHKSNCEEEYKTDKEIATNYTIPLMDYVVNKPESKYSLLFKTTDSILNKMWRKNKLKDNNVSLANLKDEIHDLVRTEVVASTLDSANFFMKRCKKHYWKRYDLGLAKSAEQNGITQVPSVESLIDFVEFEPEMKMESGYFAYHGLVRFKDLIVEIQIYSELSRQWRALSHILYETRRLSPPTRYEFGSKEAKLISLGHLLHLAECEFQSLLEEFADIH